MAQKHILVVEDDPSIRRGLVDALDFHNFKVTEAKTGDQGHDLASAGDFDLVLLDVILPGRDGFAILKEVRKVRPTLPVIMMTAKGAEDDRVQGLKLGADDYVVKPFSIKELIARVEAVLRRSAERPSDVKEIKFPGGSVDLARCEVRFKDGERKEISEREQQLLRYLACNPGRAISRDEILSRVWRISAGGSETRTIDMHVARLREKLRDDSAQPALLLTVRGKGYMLGEGVGQC